MSESWRLSGQYMESCNCKPACPCVFLSRPTEGNCTVVVGWHIDEGHYGEVDLGGLNVGLAADSPGTMHEVPWKAALYLDERASEKQRDALVQIFGGHSGGHPSRLASHIGQVLGVASVPIEFTQDGKRRTLRIGKVADVDIEAIGGAGGADVQVSGHPLCVAPGHPVTVAKSKGLRYEDHGYRWTLSERNGMFSPFTYQN